MIQFGNRGPLVRSLQEALIRQGIELPRYGADGSFGPETRDGVAVWLAQHHDLELDDDPTDEKVPDATLQAVLQGGADAKYQEQQAATYAIVNAQRVQAPAGLRIVTWHDDPKLLSKHAPKRKVPPTQFVFHRGAQTRANDPMVTKASLDRQGYSSMFTLTPDGELYQHFDTYRRGRHATHHNVQSDSMDIQGPLFKKRMPAPGQKLLTLKLAIGRKNDVRKASDKRAAILARKHVTVRYWSLTPAQADALALFVPWWCDLRGIPLRACSDHRTFRVGGTGRADPVTNVTGLLSHTNIAGPGQRVDGCVAFQALKAADAPIEWRPASEFWDR